MSNKEWVRIGSIKKSKAGKQYLSLGEPSSKFKPYSVELVVKDAAGKVIAKVENPALTVQNPRKRPGITEEELNKIPEFILAQISLAPSKE